jgi:hypothetical protein
MGGTYNLRVSLPVLKELTARLHEGQTHDDVLRDLLDLNPRAEAPESDEYENWLAAPVEALVQGGFFSRGLWLPNGTQLRAQYKGQEFRARVEANSWLDERGKRHTSPSAAATAITGTNVNGLRFWEAKRPGDNSWRRLEILAQS